MNILALSGSLRAGSYNTALLRTFEKRGGSRFSFVYGDLKLPLFNQDDELERYPAEAALLKRQIREADGVLISTPEYNRGTSGVLKNAIDWTSRPEGDGAWKGKAVYIIGASNGTLGTALAQYDLKRTMTYFGAHLLGQPEFYGTFMPKKLDEAGNVTDETTLEKIDAALDAFAAFIEKTR